MITTGSQGAPVLGTREWAATTGGVLDRPARLRFARDAVFAQLAEFPQRVRARLLAGGNSALVTHREPPDTPLAREMLSLAESAYDAPLLGHCVRCWLWGDLIAQRRGHDYDDELLYVASLLHDIALTDDHRTGAAGCFAVDGGEVARSTLLPHGEPFAERVAEAITLHMNVRVPVALGVEAHLLHAAAHLDVAGTGLGDLPSAAVRAVAAKHPRDGFPSAFARLMRREAGERPTSRAAVLWRLGMRLPLSHNPLDQQVDR